MEGKSVEPKGGFIVIISDQRKIIGLTDPKAGWSLQRSPTAAEAATPYMI